MLTFLNENNRSVRITVSTQDSQSCNRGSIPLPTTRKGQRFADLFLYILSLSTPCLNDEQDKKDKRSRYSGNVSDCRSKMQASSGMRSHHEITYADKCKESSRHRTHPMRLLPVGKICRRCPEHQCCKNLVEYSHILPYFREVHLAAEERKGKYRDTYEESLKYRLLIRLQKIRNRKSKASEGRIA